MTKMRAVQINKAHGAFELVEKEIPEPKKGEVRIHIKACGICHSDAMVKEAAFPGITFPRVPGHEVAGVIDAIGPEVTGWKIGQRVGIGWYGGHCGHCDSCRRGDFITCQTNPLVAGLSYDGGYADYMVAPESALALIPDNLSFVEAAPLMCAGVTTYNALRHSGAVAGDLVAVLGIGGLGHLAVQFAVKMGFKTVAIARGDDKEALSKQLGAFSYINSETTDAGSVLKKMGGAKVILATVTKAELLSSMIEGLGVNGKLLIVGASTEPFNISTIPLITGRRSIAGWPSGSSIDSQDTMDFSALSNIRSMNEIFPLEKAAEAYTHMMSGKARFRVVLKMDT